MSQQMNSNKLLEIYNSSFKPALTAGKYEVVLLNHKYVADEQNPYIRLEFQVKETGRILVENRFIKSFPILVSHLRQQLGRESEEIIPATFLDELIKNKTTINLWVVKRTINGVPRTNFQFLEPLPEQPTTTTKKPNTEVVDDDTDTVTPIK